MSDRSERTRGLEELTRRALEFASTLPPREYFGEYLRLKIPEIDRAYLDLPIELLEDLLKLALRAAETWERRAKESICTEKEGETVERETTERTEAERSPRWTEPPRLAPGDVVRLKSGGPPLTVLGPEANPIGVPRLILAWFSAGGELRTDRLPPSVLERVENPGTVEAKGEERRPPRVKRARDLVPGDRLSFDAPYLAVVELVDRDSRNSGVTLHLTRRETSSSDEVLRWTLSLPSGLEVAVR